MFLSFFLSFLFFSFLFLGTFDKEVLSAVLDNIQRVQEEALLVR